MQIESAVMMCREFNRIWSREGCEVVAGFESIFNTENKRLLIIYLYPQVRVFVQVLYNMCENLIFLKYLRGVRCFKTLDDCFSFFADVTIPDFRDSGRNHVQNKSAGIVQYQYVDQNELVLYVIPAEV